MYSFFKVVGFIFITLVINAAVIGCSAGTSNTAGNSLVPDNSQPEPLGEDSVPVCYDGNVPVSGYAQNFVTFSKIKDAIITMDIYDRPDEKLTTKTDSDGRFVFCIPPGSNVTLTFEKHSLDPFDDYKTTQGETVIVPPEGINGIYNEITFQVPTVTAYDLLKFVITTARDIKVQESGACQLSTTIAGYHMTLQNLPQGVADAKVTINGEIYASESSGRPYYFGIFPDKYTDPFSSHLTSTSLDGGVLIYNLPASNQIQTISAYKPDSGFTEVKFICRSGSFINISPPRGPHLTN